MVNFHTATPADYPDGFLIGASGILIIVIIIVIIIMVANIVITMVITKKG